MRTIKLMNVLLSNAEQFLNEPSLLCRSTVPWRRNQSDSGAWILEGPGRHDFMTFFNALSVAKWREYTIVHNFYLHLEVMGSACSIQQTRADAFSRSAIPIPETKIDLPETGEWTSIDLPLNSAPHDVLESFLIECSGPISIRNSFYYTKVEDSLISPVELALCTTTFKKEDFVLNNIDLVRSEILESDEAIAGHFTMHVVDNGRTLDAKALSHDSILIHPNENVGGAGGFARGMIEAMEQTPRATHVLLMDDDVAISTESIIRTFNLLSLVSEEYRDAFIAGAMMNLEEPAVLWEDGGFVRTDGLCDKIKPGAHMDVMHSVVANESYDVPDYLPGCADQTQRYAAWWYCVIPMTQIEKNGLPLPIFVRYDDVEYGRRCKPKFMSMNGICVWHLPFFLRYSAAQECYQTTRNALINAFASDFAPMSDIEGRVRQTFESRLMSFNYDDAELVLRGLEDFLRGPDWIMQPVAQEAFLDANRSAEKFSSFESLHAELSELGISLDGITDWQLYRDLPMSRMEHFRFRRSLNGQRGDRGFTVAGKTALIDAFNFDGGQGRYCRAETVIAVDVPNRRASIRRINRKRFAKLFTRFSAALKELNSNRTELKLTYQSAFSTMTSIEFWRCYLSI